MKPKELILHKLHSAHGAVFAEYNGFLLPSRYKSTREEYDLLKNGIGVLDLSHRGKLRLRGKEHLRFLQGMLSNDVIGLDEGGGLHATLLNLKGKMLADLRLYKLENQVLIDMENQIVGNIHDLLLKYRLSYKAVIEDITQQYLLLSFFGTGVKQFLGNFFSKHPINPESPGIELFSFRDTELMVVSTKRSKLKSLDLYIPVDKSGLVDELMVHENNGISPEFIGHDTYEILRIEAAIPRYGTDMDENTIPIEAGLWDALNFEKGCYVGQEVIARIKWRGHVNRHLCLVEVEGSVLPAAKDKIFASDRETGYITSSVFSYERNRIIALAYLRRGFNDPGTRIKIQSGENELTGQVAESAG